MTFCSFEIVMATCNQIYVRLYSLIGFCILPDKSAFSADGSACSALMFGLKIRWITFQFFFSLELNFLFFDRFFDFASGFSVGFPVFVFRFCAFHVPSAIVGIVTYWFFCLSSNALMVLRILFWQVVRVYQLLRELICSECLIGHQSH